MLVVLGRHVGNGSFDALIYMSVSVASEGRASERNTVGLGHLSPPVVDADILDGRAPGSRGIAVARVVLVGSQ